MCLMFNKCLNDSEQVNKIVYNELSFISIKIYILIAQTIEVYVELLPGDLSALRTEAYALYRIAYPQHRHPLAGDVAPLARMCRGYSSRRNLARPYIGT